MKIPNTIGIHVFRSDLSIIDNIAIETALKRNIPLIFLFIYTPEQISKNKYNNPQSIQFLHESLIELQCHINKRGGKFIHLLGDQYKILNQLTDLIHQYDLNTEIYLNDDYSEYARKRDDKILNMSMSKEIYLFRGNHKSLINIEQTRKDDGKLYSKFTPFYRKALLQNVRKCSTNKIKFNIAAKMGTKFFNTHSFEKNILSKMNTTDISYLSNYYTPRDLRQKGGRSNALAILKNLNSIQHYKDTRDTLILPTSGLSAHIKFGNVTIREVYHTAKKLFKNKNEAFIRQLYWRDFYYSVALLFSEKYPNQSIYTWQNNIDIDPMPRKEKKILQSKRFKAWKEGKTGFPIVDAAMRELNNTGFMHNRVRMMVASFIAKTLILNWRKGERYFAEKLVDYDFCMNFGNWCWVVGNFSHSQAPFRILSPWAQSKKADPDTSYIKKWIPELKDVPPQHLHQWDEHFDQYQHLDYPNPIVDYKEQRKIWGTNYRKLL